MIKTYSFDDGKYEFDRDQAAGCLTAVRRNDEHWPAGWDDFQFSKVIHAMLNRIDELEDRFFFVKDAPGAWLDAADAKAMIEWERANEN